MDREFTKCVDSLTLIFDFVSQFATTHRIGDESRHIMEFGIEEIFVNMVKYNNESTLDINLKLEVHGNEFRACLTDRDVHSFDPNDQPPVNVDCPIEDRKPGGLGIHLIKAMLDDVYYEYENRICKITLVKHLEEGHA